VEFAAYARAAVENGHWIIDHLVGDLQRIVEYPKQGFAIPQPVPASVRAAYQRLVGAGFTSRLLAT
jgi:hypothetical protein